MVVDHLKNDVYKINMEKLQINICKAHVNETNNIANHFVINNINSNQSLTIANSIRRILLSENFGIKIQKFQITGIKNEYTNIPGIREDILDIILNIKQIILKNKNNKKQIFGGKLVIKKSGIITANCIKFDSDIKIINPNQYIMTVTKPINLEFKFLIYGNDNKINALTKNEDWFDLTPICNPILNVNFSISPIKFENSDIENKDCIKFEIITDGSITPKDSIKLALKKFYEFIYPLTLYKI